MARWGNRRPPPRPGGPRRNFVNEITERPLRQMKFGPSPTTAAASRARRAFRIHADTRKGPYAMHFEIVNDLPQIQNKGGGSNRSPEMAAVLAAAQANPGMWIRIPTGGNDKVTAMWRSRCLRYTGPLGELTEVKTRNGDVYVRYCDGES